MMKCIFECYKWIICKYSIMLVTLFFAWAGLSAQEAKYKDGILQGVVKVKFDESMTSTLSRMSIKARGNKLSTGIKPFDAVAQSINAMYMERLIPECTNIALEAKHRKAGLHLWYIVEFDESVAPQAALKALKAVAGVKEVMFEHYKKLPQTAVSLYTPSPSTFSALPFNDPYLKDQWHYINTGQLGLSGDRADVNLGPAWQITAGRPDVIISVHDEGIDVNHEDLRANMWVNTKEIPGNGIDDDGNGYIDDIYGFDFVDQTGKIPAESHGTHVAGTIAAVNNNGKGVSGVAGGTGIGDGVRIMSARVLGGAEPGFIMRSYVYAADMGSVISQNSWGYTKPGVYEKDVLDGIDYFINYAGDYPNSPMKGGIVIFASGNDSMDDRFWPGYYEKCFSVSAIGPEWKIASYSNFGDWIHVSAPGGDQRTYEMSRAGVLSTLPYNQYGYIHGTSMACPHVSGIAGLVLSNTKKQITNKELWNILLTATKDLDPYNPDYAGKLGTGAIDAALALAVNKGIAPDAIQDLQVISVSQEFATISWSVPADEDDGLPFKFNIYYSKENITPENLSKATRVELINKKALGETITYEVNNLEGTTQYYVVVMGVDRWGNEAVLSNILTLTTNAGPDIGVNTGNAGNLLSLNINTATAFTKTQSFDLLNQSAGILRWAATTRNTGHNYSPIAYSQSQLLLPIVNIIPQGIKLSPIVNPVPVIRNQEATRSATMNYAPSEMKYTPYASVDIGDSNPTLPTSGAIKYTVKEENGFNLTAVNATVKYTQGTGPIVIQVYEGGIAKENLRRVEEYTPTYWWQYEHTIALKESIYFEKGTPFYIIVHVPSGNGYSLGVGEIPSPSYADTDMCRYSYDNGATWRTFPEVGIPSVYAWAINAVSQYEGVGNIMTLDPASGTMDGNSQTSVIAQINAEQLINGTYNANVVFESNDSKKPDFRMPVEFTVTGQKSNLTSPKVADFGSVFQNADKTVDILLENYGYGLINNLTATIDNPQFKIVGIPGTISARTSSPMRVKFSPTVAGNINGTLKITNGTNTYTISLFGVGAETAEITIDPASNTLPNITIGDEVTSTFTVKNTGKFPLQYFIDGFDTQNISKDWGSYHKYGYVVRSNKGDIASNPIAYEFNDISSIGIDITGNFIDSHYSTVQIPFDFPYYGEIQHEIHVTTKGFTVFDKEQGFPYNAPQLVNGLPGYISMLGYDISSPKIRYRAESDHLIIQYSGGSGNQQVDAQMVLWADGNIRFYYKKMPVGGYDLENVVVLIEDLSQTDGILVRDNKSNFTIVDGTVIAFDYPGPDIITEIENGSGILAPNESAVVKVKMNTATLTEGVTTRNVNVISDDPIHPISTHAAILEITSGGAIAYELSADAVDLGVLFKDLDYSKEFSIKNIGTKILEITDIEFNNAEITVSGGSSIKTGINQLYKIVPNTASVRDINETVKFTFANGDTKEVTVTGKVRLEPTIVTDLTEVSANVSLEDKFTSPYEVSNTGGSDLEVSFIGGQWFNFVESTGKTPIKHSYFVKQENNDEPSSNWIDMYNVGEKLPLDEEFTGDKELYWKYKELPFSFPFYGVEYNSIKIGENGIIALGGDPEPVLFPNENMPISGTESAYILTMWLAGSFDTYNHPEDAGVYYKVYDDKVVIAWLHFANLHGWGISTQAELYKDGTIKLQYRVPSLVSDGSGSGVVGIQNVGGQEYKVISSRRGLDHGKGLAYMIMPQNTYAVSPSQKLEGTIILDSKHIYSGSFKDTLLVKTNVPSALELKKPVAINIAGNAIIDVPTEVDLGSTEVVFDEDWWAYKSVRTNVKITNAGTAPFRITGARMKQGGQFLDHLIPMTSTLGVDYIPMEQYLSMLPYPNGFILPGASLEALVDFAPEDEGNYEDVLIFETTEGEIEITLKGFAYYPPSINIDTTPVVVSLNKPSDTEERGIAFNNADGGYKLDYNVSVNYQRQNTGVAPLEKMGTSAKQASEAKVATLSSVDKASMAIVKPFADFNRKIQYVDYNKMNNGLGNNGYTTTHVATKYVADKTGFNLSDVGTLMSLDEGISGTLNVEIRVGGSDITTAISVAKKDAEFASVDGAKFYPVAVPVEITLDEAVQVLPNEEFYVIISYPFNVNYPQGLQLGGAERVAGRYWFYTPDGWFDLQDYLASVDPATGLTMYAAERSFKESGWLKILTPESGTLQVGQFSELKISVEGTLAQRGDQQAKVVVKSSDINASVVEVPVSLHLNQAPAFVDAPESAMIAEKETREIDFSVVDAENNAFTLEVVEKPTFANVAINGTSEVKITLQPDYGNEGTYKIVMKATDEHDAVSEHTINIYVTKTNRAPQYTSDKTVLTCILENGIERFDINDFFADPDGDKFTFTVTSVDKNIAEVYVSGTQFFMVESRALGLGKLTFVVTDIHGASTTYDLPLSVENGLGVNDEVDVEKALNVYPNPVKAGETVTVVTRLADIHQNPVTIRVIALGGQVVTTLLSASEECKVVMPSEAGVYLVEVSNGIVSKTFNVIVK